MHISIGIIQPKDKHVLYGHLSYAKFVYTEVKEVNAPMMSVLLET